MQCYIQYIFSIRPNKSPDDDVNEDELISDESNHTRRLSSKASVEPKAHQNLASLIPDWPTLQAVKRKRQV